MNVIETALNDHLGRTIDIDNAMAFIERISRLAGHFPDTEMMDRARRVIVGKITEAEAIAEIGGEVPTTMPALTGEDAHPDSVDVLVNRLGIPDAIQLNHVVTQYLTARLAGMVRKPGTKPDLPYLQSIHRRLFGDVFDFAGKIRDVDAHGVDIDISYYRPAYIDPALVNLFDKLTHEDYLAGIENLREFTVRLVERWSELAVIHPFLYGNIPAQCVWVSHLANRAGYGIDWAAIDVGRLREARLLAIAGREGQLSNYLERHITSSKLQLSPPRLLAAFAAIFSPAN
jgi:cell filamentation protein